MITEWNSITHARLGAIVGNLISGNAVLRRSGYISFFELKREFESGVWNAYLDKLDKFRADNKFKPLAELIDEIRNEFIKNGKALECIPEPAEFSSLSVINHEKPVKSLYEWSDKVEQLSLF
jgi:hypothetical protein